MRRGGGEVGNGSVRQQVLRHAPGTVVLAL